jgi:iron-sulfur cluster repair protein YtfE (RIC family)
MQPSEVRDRILHDHEALRHRLHALGELATQVSRDDRRQVEPMRSAAERLLDSLRRHMAWEDRELVPALADSDAWGPERARRLSAEHVEQRELLADVVAELHDPQRPPKLLATRLLDLVAVLLEDMQAEEAFFLDPDVLRDDVVGNDVESG